MAQDRLISTAQASDRLREFTASGITAAEVAEDWRHLAMNAGRALAIHDEAMARAAIKHRFPKTGAWLVEHPRALKLLFRVRPTLRPAMVYEQGKPGAREVRWP